MPYPTQVDLDQLPPYVLQKLQELQYGQKGKLAAHLGIGLAQVSHFITGTKPIPQKYIPGILSFFNERADVQIISTEASPASRPK